MNIRNILWSIHTLNVVGTRLYDMLYKVVRIFGQVCLQHFASSWFLLFVYKSMYLRVEICEGVINQIYSYFGGEF